VGIINKLFIFPRTIIVTFGIALYIFRETFAFFVNAVSFTVAAYKTLLASR